MKDKITDHLKSMFLHARQWAELEIEYAKLTAAEKLTILSSAVVLGFVSLLLVLLVLILLSFALVDAFAMMMPPALAHLSVAGIVLLIMILIIILRKPLLTNPIARFITKLIIDRNESTTENEEKA